MNRNTFRNFLFGNKTGVGIPLNITPVSGEALVRNMRVRKSMYTMEQDTENDIAFLRVMRSRKGMTLIEVLVAMAIIAIVSVMVVMAFGATLKSEMRSTVSKNNSAKVEKRIASGATGKKQSVPFGIGGFDIETSASKYTAGDRSYSVLGGNDIAETYGIIFGDLTRADTSALAGIYGDEYAINCGKQGGVLEVAAPYSGRYFLEAWGAKGGDAGNPSGTPGLDFVSGANGGYACGEIYLEEGTILNFYAGGVGFDDQRTSSAESGAALQGGFNGGGMGKAGDYGHASGGGGTDIRITGNTLYDRVIVAGGGGGGGCWTTPISPSGAPGVGGGANGIDSESSLSSAIASGGKQSSGGNAGGAFGGNVAVFTASDEPASGGGGGWYGGGNGSVANSPGAGGSGWIFTETAFDAWEPVNGSFSQVSDKNDYNIDNYTANIATTLDGSGYRYSMTNTSLIAGNAPMPNPIDMSFDLSDPTSAAKTITGNAGGGVIRIVFISK